MTESTDAVFDTEAPTAVAIRKIREDERARIVAWLKLEEERWRQASKELGSSVAADCAAHYAQALHNAWEAIEKGRAS